MNDLTVRLEMDNGTADRLRNDEAMLVALDAYDVSDGEMAAIANADMRLSIARVAELKKMREDFIAPATQIIERARELFNPAIQAREAFAQGLRKKLEVWTLAEKAKADEARRIAEEADRKRRQEAEAIAATERAKAAQEAAQARRQAEEAKKAGDAALAASLALQAQQTVQNAEAKAQEVTLQAAAASTVVADAEKVNGFSMRAHWVAELVTTEADAVVAIAKQIAAGRGDLVPLLKLDASAANSLARALKSAFTVDGLRAVNRPISTSRG